ncbi:MAG: carboxypeptidase-like regulatory domain-containing protein [Bacteroidales bacterium]|nr:carboxypeptidase-like regulatory domain-containing protein [Bacteroidales bacterium]
MISWDKCAKYISGIATLMFLFCPLISQAQESILDSLLTFKSGNVKIGNALNIISRQTGYYFTFDSKLINRNKKVNFTFENVRLKEILRTIIGNDSVDFTVVNKYIIIFKPQPVAEALPEMPTWEIKEITGTVTDEETGEPIPYVSISLPKKGKGTITNTNGEFMLKIYREWIYDTLIISQLGYYKEKIPISRAVTNKLNISLKRDYVPIPEIIIRNQLPTEIVRKAYLSITKNFGNSPALLMAFYREAVIKKNDLQIYSEAIVEIYKSSYSATFAGDQMKIIKSRKIENTGLKDTLTVRLKAGLQSCLSLDGARNPFDFIIPENFSQYDYRMTDIVKVDQGTAYVIEFIQKPFVDIPLFMGSIYINTMNYAIEHAEFELNPAFIKKNKEDYITYQSKDYKIMPISVKYQVSYKNIGERYFLNHVRGDLNFTAHHKKRLFNTPFKVFFEMAVTDIKTENVARFDREEIAPLHSVFSKTIKSYDPEFWDDFDFLKPESNLLQELKNMKARFQEFSNQ